MRKKVAWILVLIFMLTGCTNANPDVTNADTAPSAPQATLGEHTNPTVDTNSKTFSFTLQGRELIPGAVFDEKAMPEPDSVFQVPSCAIEGTDNVYNYGTVEVTVFDDGKNKVVYSVFLVDANTPTSEGLYLGDDLAQAEAIYGDGYDQQDTQVVYQRGETLLILILNGGYIASIEYRMAT